MLYNVTTYHSRFFALFSRSGLDFHCIWAYDIGMIVSAVAIAVVMAVLAITSTSPDTLAVMAVAGVFAVDARSMRQLERFAKQVPQQFLQATQYVLNAYAFGVRNQAVDTVSRSMTVRNAGFVRASLRYQMTRRGRIEGMTSRVGSVARGKSTGFREQHEGSRTPSRMPAMFARRDNVRSRVSAARRINRLGSVLTIDQLGGVRPGDWGAMLARVSRDHRGEPFMMDSYRGLPRGIWMVTRAGQLRLVQNLDAAYAVRRNPWLVRARDEFVQVNPPQEIWAAQLRKVLKMPSA